LSLNLYTYCANNPLVYYDPSGHFFESILNKIKDTVGKIFIKDKESNKERQNSGEKVSSSGKKEEVKQDHSSKNVLNLGFGPIMDETYRKKIEEILYKNTSYSDILQKVRENIAKNTTVNETKQKEINTIDVANNNGKSYKKGDIIQEGVYKGWKVEQGFDDRTTDYYKGHLGYDLTNNGNSENIYPITEGEIAHIDRLNSTANGNIVVVKHEMNGIVYYSSYSHLENNSIPSSLKKGQSVIIDTEIGIMGGTGGKQTFSPHLHLAIYTGSFSSNPWGYSDPTKIKEFPEPSDHFEKNGRIFYDPMKFMNTNGGIAK
jgi:murein DD-endopeptidase MepM/ murein hydrolase activator NlpD